MTIGNRNKIPQRHSERKIEASKQVEEGLDKEFELFFQLESKKSKFKIAVRRRSNNKSKRIVKRIIGYILFVIVLLAYLSGHLQKSMIEILIIARQLL